ncbi:MAG: hypothetical protein AAB461_02250 [Patescibacteria group bacterium]
MLKALPKIEYIYTCLETFCGERSTIPLTTCGSCGSTKISIMTVFKKNEYDFVSLPEKERRHPLVEDDLGEN